jgi:hypothetical protein
VTIGRVGMPKPDPPTLSAGNRPRPILLKGRQGGRAGGGAPGQIFKDIHANPELAFREEKTAALVARRFKELGYETHTAIGKTGVVGELNNGPGPTVWPIS